MHKIMMQKRATKKENDSEDVDFAKAADFFAGTASEDDADDDVEELDEAESGDDSEDEIDTESADEYISGDDEAVSESEDNGQVVQQAASLPLVANGEQCTFDLLNLLAMNVHQINSSRLYSKQKIKSKETVTIPASENSMNVDEDYLLEKATDGCSQLVAALWQLPVERSDVGPMVTLPSFDASKIPRALVCNLDS
jgi:hypothetical protein